MNNKGNNLSQLLEESATCYPQRIALVFGARRISYRQLNDSREKLAYALNALGISKQQKVALWLPNCPEFVISFFATLKLAAVVVPINTMLKREEARFMIEDSKAKVLICSIDKLDDAENILSRSATLEKIISLPAPQDSSLTLSFHTLIKDSPRLSGDPDIAEDDLAEIVYTSGTTGKPKGACLTHKNLISNVRDCAEVIKFNKRDCIICILPLFHSFSSTVCMLVPLSKGAKVVIMRSVRPFKRVMRAIFKQRVTIFAGVPSLYSILVEAKISGLKRLLNIVVNPIRVYVSGAAALPSRVWEQFEKKFKRPLVQGYGLTEASPVVSLNPLKGKRKPDSIGLSLPSVKIKIVDKSDQELDPGLVGELLVKGPNVMKGYYNLPQENEKTLKQGWLYTGDLAKKDKDGYFYIMGRIKEMINVRGFNVYPKEIEELIYKYPQVKEAAVVGVNHRHRGEVPVAFIVALVKIEQKDVIDYLKSNLASYKVPLRILSRESLPKNPTGKILKRQLQEEIKDIFA